MISCEFPQIKFNKFNIVSISIYVIITNEFHWLFILWKVTQRCYVRWRDIRGSHNVACGMVGSLNHDLLRIGPLVQHDYHHHLLLLFIVIYLLLITQANPSADHNLTTNDEQYEKQSKSRATKQHVYKMKCLKLSSVSIKIIFWARNLKLDVFWIFTASSGGSSKDYLPVTEQIFYNPY